MMQEKEYFGRCHCGNVQFKIVTDAPELTTCDCSICVRKNALMVKVHESKFLLIKGEDSLTEYQFHTKTARHFFCAIYSVKIAVFIPFTENASRLTSSALTFIV